MEKFTTISTVAAVLDRPNVDTDLIIPKQFLKRIEKSGFGRFAFYDLRFRSDGLPDPDFILNQNCFQGAGVLVSQENFGCGSSREHAPWALLDYGFRAIISPSFADIFKNNSLKNGLLLIELLPEETDALILAILAEPGVKLNIDLEAQTVTGPSGFTATFSIDPFNKEKLLNGWDDISLTMLKEDLISSYEKAHPQM